jgi:aspartate-semialdehyde dehydrogenase
MPLDATTKDDVYVGRIRRDISRDDQNGLELFVCGDQVRALGPAAGSRLPGPNGGLQR